MNKFLIIIPAGNNSLHLNYIDKKIDVCTIYYETKDRNELIIKKFKKYSKYFFELSGPKWDLINKISNLPFIQVYKYIWIPDDDLLISNILLMFELCEKYKLQLAQPSLLDNGNITPSYKNILRHEENYSTIKYTNFVEIMCPIFSLNCFNLLRYTFNLSKSGWGLDKIWPNILDKAGYQDKIAVINRIIISHTRKPNKPNEGFYAKLNIDPFKEMKSVLQLYNIRNFIPSIYFYE